MHTPHYSKGYLSPISRDLYKELPILFETVYGTLSHSIRIYKKHELIEIKIYNDINGRIIFDKSYQYVWEINCKYDYKFLKELFDADKDIRLKLF